MLDNERRVVALSPEAERPPRWRRPGRPARRGRARRAARDPRPLLRALPELSAYQELRKGFTAAVSHELRTPLARLLALLENATLPGSDVEALMEQAMQEVHETRELIDDVLFLGELETGREVVALGRTRAKPVVDEIVDSLADRADHAGVTLVVGATATSSCRCAHGCCASSSRTSSRTRSGTRARGARARSSSPTAESGPALTVSDDGGGVPATDLPRLFERFYRGDQARTSRGTGLGLAIVKHIVTSAGGTIEATSEPGAGLAIRARLHLTDLVTVCYLPGRRPRGTCRMAWSAHSRAPSNSLLSTYGSREGSAEAAVLNPPAACRTER